MPVLGRSRQEGQPWLHCKSEGKGGGAGKQAVVGLPGQLTLYDVQHCVCLIQDAQTKELTPSTVHHHYKHDICFPGGWGGGGLTLQRGSISL